jgi:hypothetical protein
MCPYLWQRLRTVCALLASNSWLVGVGLMVVMSLNWLWRWWFPPISWIAGIPILESNNWLLGFTNFVNHRAITKMLREKGPVVQFHVLGRPVISVADKTLARKVLRDVNGKGFFHNPTPDVVPPLTVSLDTNAEWARRRGAFKKEFSLLSLKNRLPAVIEMAKKLSHYVDSLAETQTVAVMDNIFCRFTMGIICQVAFELDVDVFNPSDEKANKLRNTVEEMFKVMKLDFCCNRRLIAPNISCSGFGFVDSHLRIFCVACGSHPTATLFGPGQTLSLLRQIY